MHIQGALSKTVRFAPKQQCKLWIFVFNSCNIIYTWPISRNISSFNKEIGNKLSPLFDGPFEIIELNGENVIIKRGLTLDEVHKNRTKLYTS